VEVKWKSYHRSFGGEDGDEDRQVNSESRVEPLQRGLLYRRGFTAIQAAAGERTAIGDCEEVRNGGYSDMTDERIRKIKSAVESADHISPEKKAELLDVLTKLKPAIAKVAQTHKEDAQSISRFVEASVHEVASKKERPESVERVLQKLKQSVQKFEASHPDLTAFVTEYSAVLSGLGI
jgi:prefoldin subunit 5